MKVTLEVPDEWAASLPTEEAELAEVVSAGLRRRASHARMEVDHLADIADALADLPSPEQVLALRPSPALAARIESLLSKKKEVGLSPEEAREWEDAMRVEHLVRVAKAKAAVKLKEQNAVS